MPPAARYDPPPMRTLLPFLVLFGLAAAAPGQRPRDVDEALARLEAAASQPEAARHRAVRDLGPFADERATAALLRELERAQSLSFRQAVVRALGRQPRPGAVAPLAAVLRDAANPRLADAAAEALAGQGPDGVAALAALLPGAASKSPQRNAICSGLGRSDDPAARAALLAELRRAGGRDRLPPLRALAGGRGDRDLDDVRRQLAGDRDPLVAAAALEQLAAQRDAGAPDLAIELLRRLEADAGADLYTAVLSGLLVAPAPAHFAALLTAAARAEDPFGAARTDDWQRAFADAAWVRWLADSGVDAKAVVDRVAAARALARAPEPQRGAAAPGLRKLLADRDADVVQAAATALVTADPDGARTALGEQFANATEATAGSLLGALHSVRAAEPEWRSELLAVCGHKLPTARAAALGLLATLPPIDAPAVAAAADNLAHKQWRVRAAAIDLLRASRSAGAPPLLFERLDKERARLHQDLVDALQDLTGLQFPTVSAWRQWWLREGPTFRARDARPESGAAKRAVAATAVSYWDIPVESDRVAFLVDVSGSMLQPFGTGAETRLDEAKRRLARVLGQLPPKSAVNVIPFSYAARGWSDRLQPLTKAQQKAADAFVAELVAKGPTNVHAALQLAFTDPDVDTIFLLTDGRPSAGAIVDPDQLAAEVRRWNVGRSIRIHTVAIGERSELLEQLARDSGGAATVAR